jgi:hypothetical protein
VVLFNQLLSQLGDRPDAAQRVLEAIERLIGAARCSDVPPLDA